MRTLAQTLRLKQTTGVATAARQRCIDRRAHRLGALLGGPRGLFELGAFERARQRRALVAGHLSEEKLLQVRGLADVMPLDHDTADSPLNRRISILVMNKAAERAFFEQAKRYDVDPPQKAATPASQGS